MDITAYDIWDKYKRGVSQHHKQGLYTKVDKCHRFYEGDQWSDSTGSLGKDLPMYNFIKPTVDYKVASVSQNSMVINYEAGSSEPEEVEACKVLNEYAAKKWDKLKMDTRIWETIKEAAITGDSFLYFYDSKLSSQLLESDKVFLADEQQQDIQKQPYIIVYERRLVSEVRQDAVANGMSEEDAQAIQPDRDETDTNYYDEVQGDENAKCTSLLYITRENGDVAFCRSTQTVVYEPIQVVTNMQHYPIAKMTWQKQHGSSRGVGEVKPLIPNQVEVNKTLYRRSESIKSTAFPKPVYVEGMIENPDNIGTVGTPVRIREGNVNRLDDVFKYLQPAAISSDAKTFLDEMMDTTRELANAGDAALGNINPESASGAAIVAVKDAAAVPLNEHKSAGKQLVEDIAIIWYDQLTAYNPDGLDTEFGGVTAETLERMEPEIRIEVSDGNPYSKYAREQALQNALAAGHITFEEYVEALDEDAQAPKAKFAEILKTRQAQRMEQAGGMEQPVEQPVMQTQPEIQPEVSMEEAYGTL